MLVSVFLNPPRLSLLSVQAQLAPEAGGLGGKSYVLTCGEGDFPSRRLRQMAASFQVYTRLAVARYKTRTRASAEGGVLFLGGGVGDDNSSSSRAHGGVV